MLAPSAMHRAQPGSGPLKEHHSFLLIHICMYDMKDLYLSYAVVVGSISD